MAEIVGVRFRTAGKIYYFNPAGVELKEGDPVVVKTAGGEELGWVVITPRQVPDGEIKEPLKTVVRQAEEKDLNIEGELVAKEAEALAECNKLIATLGLNMKPISVEYNLEGSRAIIFFSAGERIDFRELVRELARNLKIRVELRQIGPRDETKIIGGYGRCGRPLCCASFLTEFAPVSIKMAKEQNLPLNPMKISGVCGRLLCCLVYEQGFYHEVKKRMPRVGQRVTTALGAARVMGTNLLQEMVMVELESKATAELPLGEIKFEESKPARGGKPEKRG
jgi:cell fate regulator YaaT (PSP1 superfamily)